MIREIMDELAWRGKRWGLFKPWAQKVLEGLQQEEGKVVGWAPNSLAFAQRCCARLQCLLA